MVGGEADSADGKCYGANQLDYGEKNRFQV
jgi:hypothetical protein